jgi:HD domain
VGQVEWARELARSLLEEPLPRRWAHTQGVATQAETLRPILGNDADLLVAAAWLHDIGYSPDLVKTGFHPLDGARYLRDTHRANPGLCNLVARHTYAIIEAEERGLANELNHEFASVRVGLTQALVYCDMTTAPDGSNVSINDRLAEIYGRYGDSHVVSKAIRRAETGLRASVMIVERRLDAAGSKRC